MIIDINKTQIAAILETTKSLVIDDGLKQRVAEAEKLLLDNLDRLIEAAKQEKLKIENRPYRPIDVAPLIVETLSFGLVKSNYTRDKERDIERIDKEIRLYGFEKDDLTNKDLSGAAEYLDAESFLKLPHITLTTASSVLAVDADLAVAILRSAFSEVFSNVIHPDAEDDSAPEGGFLETDRYLISSKTLEILKTIRDDPALVGEEALGRWEEYSNDHDLNINIEGEFSYKITPKETTAHRKRLEGKDRPREIMPNDIGLGESDKVAAASTIVVILDNFHRGQQEEGVRALHQLMKNFAAKQVNAFLDRDRGDRFP